MSCSGAGHEAVQRHREVPEHLRGCNLRFGVVHSRFLHNACGLQSVGQTLGHLMVDCNQLGRKRVEQEARSGCPINAAVEAFGDSWSLLVLRDVMFGNRRYFRELLAGSEERIASNILADRLKRLVSAGLLTREDAGPGRRAAYSLTEASIQLVPVFAQLGEWGLRHRPDDEAAAGARRNARSGRPAAVGRAHGRATGHPPWDRSARTDRSQRHRTARRGIRRCKLKPSSHHLAPQNEHAMAGHPPVHRRHVPDTEPSSGIWQMAGHARKERPAYPAR